MSIKNDHISVKPPSTNRLVFGIIAIAVLCAGVASQLEYSKKEHVTGYIQASGGDLRIVAPVRGVVNFNAKLNDTLTQNQPLATIKSTETLSAGASILSNQKEILDNKAVSLKAEMDFSEKSLQSRLLALNAQKLKAIETVAQAKAEVATRKQFITLEEARLARQKELQAQGFVSSVALDQYQADLLVRKADLQNAERAVTQAQSQVSAIEAELATTQTQMKSQKEQLKRELGSVEQATTEAQRADSVTVVAPKPVTILTLAANSGDSVEPGQLLAKLSPKDAKIEAMLLLTPASAGRVKVGQTVALQMTAYPYQTYGLVKAEIVEIESAPVLSDETGLRSSGVPAGTVVIKAIAKINDVPEKIGQTTLRSGMQFTAAIEVERKSFLSWMIWPLLKHFI